MKCPNAECGRKIQVSDSREKADGKVKRRRRCNSCVTTYTTSEAIQFEDVNMPHSSIQLTSKTIDYNTSFNEIRKHLELLEKSISSLNTKP